MAKSKETKAQREKRLVAESRAERTSLAKRGAARGVAGKEIEEAKK